MTLSYLYQQRIVTYRNTIKQTYQIQNSNMTDEVKLSLVQAVTIPGGFTGAVTPTYS